MEAQELTFKDKIQSIIIESDGTSAGTKITTPNGTVIDGVTRVEIIIDADNIVEARLHILSPQIIMSTGATFYTGIKAEDRKYDKLDLTKPEVIAKLQSLRHKLSQLSVENMPINCV